MSFRPKIGGAGRLRGSARVPRHLGTAHDSDQSEADMLGGTDMHQGMAPKTPSAECPEGDVTRQACCHLVFVRSQTSKVAAPTMAAGWGYGLVAGYGCCCC